MISVGDKLILHDSPHVYEIKRFYFDLNDSGSMECYVTLKCNCENAEPESPEPTWIILDLIKRGEMYKPESAEMMKTIHESRNKNKQTI